MERKHWLLLAKRLGTTLVYPDSASTPCLLTTKTEVLKNGDQASLAMVTFVTVWPEFFPGTEIGDWVEVDGVAYIVDEVQEKGGGKFQYVVSQSR